MKTCQTLMNSKIISKYAAMLAVLPVLASAPALASPKDAEAFINNNVESVMELLNKPTPITSDDRSDILNIAKNMIDMPKMAKFVLGKYGRRVDQEVYARYLDSFETYALSFYNQNLLRLAGASMQILGTVELKPNDYVVKSLMTTPPETKMRIDWRVRRKENGDMKILDMGININGNLLWVMQEQRAQFAALLDQSGGNVEALIAQLEQKSKAQLEQQNYYSNR